MTPSNYIPLVLFTIELKRAVKTHAMPHTYSLHFTSANLEPSITKSRYQKAKSLNGNGLGAWAQVTTPHWEVESPTLNLKPTSPRYKAESSCYIYNAAAYLFLQNKMQEEWLRSVYYKSPRVTKIHQVSWTSHNTNA